MNDSDRSDERDHLLRRARLLGDDAVDPHRLRSARDEAARASKRKAEEREQQRAREIDWLRKSAPSNDEISALREEIANLRAEMIARHEAACVVAGEALGDFSDKAVNLMDKTVNEVRDMLTTEIARKFGEVQGRIDAMLPDHRSRDRSEKRFEFASEKDDGDLLHDVPGPSGVLRKTRMN
jgi:hypothetical protein